MIQFKMRWQQPTQVFPGLSDDKVDVGKAKIYTKKQMPWMSCF